MLRVPAILLFIVAAGCNVESLLPPPEDQAIAKKYIELLRDRNFDEIEKAVDPSMKSFFSRDTLIQMADLIPAQDPKSMKLVGAQTMHDPSGTTTQITFEYEFSAKWLVVNVATQRKADLLTIIGFYVTSNPASLKELNKFRLEGKSALHYSILVMAVIFPLFTLYALIVCLRTNIPGRKWPWIFFIILGLGKLSVIWTTGDWYITPLSVQLFSAGASAEDGPWTLSVSLPLGAIIFLFRRKTSYALAKASY